MEIISYHYTNTMKQLMISSIMLYFLLRLVIIGEIVIFDIPGYDVNILFTVVLYVIIFAALMTLLLGYKFCYTLYDDNTITYYNRLLKKERSIEINDIKKVVLGKRGVNFYKEDSDESAFFIPFFRGGIIEALEINNFYTKIKAAEGIHVIKDFKVLPGYGKPFVALKVLYVFLAILIFLNCFTPLATIIILYQSFM